MKVKVTKAVPKTVDVQTLEVGDGFMFDGYPHVVATSSLGENGLSYPHIKAFNLAKSNMVALRKGHQVALTEIEVTYTV